MPIFYGNITGIFVWLIRFVDFTFTHQATLRRLVMRIAAKEGRAGGGTLGLKRGPGSDEVTARVGGAIGARTSVAVASMTFTSLALPERSIALSRSAAKSCLCSTWEVLGYPKRS